MTKSGKVGRHMAIQLCPTVDNQRTKRGLNNFVHTYHNDAREIHGR